MESTNELVTATEANTEGLSISPSNECITKQEFNDNLPQGGDMHIESGNYSHYTTVINSSSRDVNFYVNADSFSGDAVIKSKEVYQYYGLYAFEYHTGDYNQLQYDVHYCYGNSQSNMYKLSKTSQLLSYTDDIAQAYDSDFCLQVIILRDV